MEARLARPHALSFVFVLLMASSAAAAQTPTFDAVSFTPPPGWAAAQDRDHVTFTFIDSAARTYVMLAVYNSTEGSGNAERDFSSEWNELVDKSFSAGSAPRSTAGQSRAGLKFREGGAQVRQQNGAPSYVRLLVFPADRRRFSVMLIATNEKALEARQPAVQSFLDSLRLASPSAATAKPAEPVGGSATPRSGSGITGVWMGFKPTWATMSRMRAGTPSLTMARSLRIFRAPGLPASIEKPARPTQARKLTGADTLSPTAQAPSPSPESTILRCCRVKARTNSR